MSNLQAFFEMGGHGLYVWLCYGVGLLVFLMIGLAPSLKRRAVLKQVRQQHRRMATDNDHSMEDLGNFDVNEKY